MLLSKVSSNKYICPKTLESNTFIDISAYPFNNWNVQWPQPSTKQVSLVLASQNQMYLEVCWLLWTTFEQLQQLHYLCCYYTVILADIFIQSDFWVFSDRSTCHWGAGRGGLSISFKDVYYRQTEVHHELDPVPFQLGVKHHQLGVKHHN